MYTTHEFYTNKYLQGRTAVLDTANFPFYERKASMIIQKYTFNRIDVNKPVLEVVQMCTCELTEYIYKQDNSEHKPEIASEKVSEWSITYVAGQIAEDIKRSTINDIIYIWLSSTGLLYRGI